MGNAISKCWCGCCSSTNNNGAPIPEILDDGPHVASNASTSSPPPCAHREDAQQRSDFAYTRSSPPAQTTHLAPAVGESQSALQSLPSPSAPVPVVERPPPQEEEAADQRIVDIATDGLDGDLASLIDDIQILLRYVKGSSSSQDARPSLIGRWKNFIDTPVFATFKEFFSATADAASDLLNDSSSNDQGQMMMSATKTMLKGLGKCHWVASGLVAIGFVLDRFDTIESNKEECLDLLDEMCRLAGYLHILKQRPKLRHEIEGLMEEALQVIIDGAGMCFSQSKSSRWYKFFGGPVQKKHLQDLRHRIQKMYQHLILQVVIQPYDANQPPALPRMEFYPKDAVIPQEKLGKIMHMLELESEKKVVAVILYGFGGIGKTTLADAIYASVAHDLGFQFSKTMLFQNIGIRPDTVNVQTLILKDICKSPVARPSTSTDGQKLLLRYFEQDACFVYIDNVLDGTELAKVLPERLGTSKKLRLLLTARDASVRYRLQVGHGNDVKDFLVDSMDNSAALKMLKDQMESGSAGNAEDEVLNAEQMKYLMQVCGGIPLVIKMVGTFLDSEIQRGRSVEEALDIIKQERQHEQGHRYGGENVEFFSFTLDTLEDCYTDAFLDMCAFSSQRAVWSWSTLEDVYGTEIMEVLERRALLQRSPFFEYAEEAVFKIDQSIENVKVHDVILEMGQKKGQSSRITSVSQLQLRLHSNDWRGVKGIVLMDAVIDEPSTLPAEKLDLISSSLRIFATGYSRTGYSRDGGLLIEGIKVVGECKAAFENLIYWTSWWSSPPMDVMRCLRLRKLDYQATNVVSFQQIPSTLEQLTLRFEGEAWIGGQNRRVIDCPQHGSVVSTLKQFWLGGNYVWRIPSGLLLSMKCLVELKLFEVNNLRFIPDELHTLPHLRTISITGASIKVLPSHIGSCTSLWVLRLSDCRRLTRLPLGFENLSSLEQLSLKDCSNITALPDNFGRLVSLKMLFLVGCQNLQELGTTFHNLPCLELLDLQGCIELKSKWINQFVHMKNLKLINIRGSPCLIRRWHLIDKHDVNIKCIYS